MFPVAVVRQEDDAVILFDSYFTFELKLGWHRLFLTVESTREIRTVVVVSELLVVSSCTGTQRNETLTNCVTTPCMDMKTIEIPQCTGTPGQPRIVGRNGRMGM